VRSGGIAIATVTLVRDAGEDGLLRRALPSLARRGTPVYVSDGGSGEAFTTFLSGLKNVRVVASKGPGLVGQVTAALEAAVNGSAEFVLYTESDKEAFFQDGIGPLLARASALPAPALVLAARGKGSFATFPPIQRHTEHTINDLCGESFRAQGDYSYGPFLMHGSLIPWLTRAPADLGWGWRHFLFAIAHRLGHHIVHVEGDHACPEDQRAEDDRARLHRLKQLDQNISGLQAGLSVQLP
jgi:hypothetical protein